MGAHFVTPVITAVLIPGTDAISTGPAPIPTPAAMTSLPGAVGAGGGVIPVVPTASGVTNPFAITVGSATLAELATDTTCMSINANDSTSVGAALLCNTGEPDLLTSNDNVVAADGDVTQLRALLTNNQDTILELTRDINQSIYHSPLTHRLENSLPSDSTPPPRKHTLDN